MTDLQRTIEFLDDPLGDPARRYATVRAALDAIEALAVKAIARGEVTEQRHAALLAGLDALVADWQRRATALQGEWGYLTYQESYIERARELADELAKHREPR